MEEREMNKGGKKQGAREETENMKREKRWTKERGTKEK